MPEATHSANLLRFGVFELDLRAGELCKQGRKIRLQEKPLQILALLLEHPGSVVTREELREQLWAGDTFVDFDHGINTAVKKLRKALGDSAENPRFIETLPRHGYRFIGHVEPLESVSTPPVTEEPHPASAEAGLPDRPPAVSAPAAAGHPPTAAQDDRDRSRWLAAIAVAGVAAIVVFGVLLALNVGGLRGRLAAAVGAGHGAPFPKIDSIAVLPLENLSGDPEQEYFADGMTEELITDLGKISALRVISRQSIMRYKGSKKPLPEIGRELHVDAVVEGTVLRSGNRVRITANLLYAPTDRHLWAQTYERDLGNVLSLQDEVARAIASQVKIKLTPQEQVRLAATRTVNPEAHRLYLLGRFYWNKRSEEGFKKAIGLFQRAIEADPAYAPAYAGLADSYNLSSYYSYRRPRDAYPKAKAAALKALQIDDTSAEAHTSLALVHFQYDWDWASSEKEFKRAIELNPNYATAHQWYADYLSDMRRHAEAVAEGQRSYDVDPLSPIISVSLAWQYIFVRQYDRGIRGLQETISLFPEFAVGYRSLADAYLSRGRYDEAIGALQKERSLSGASPDEVAALGQAYAKGGIRGYYLWELRRIREQSMHRYIRPADFAYCFAALGDKDQAFSYLERAYEDRDVVLTQLQVDPEWDSLRSDPRFQALVRRMNFPP